MEGFIVDREYKSSLKCLRIGDKIAELPIIQGGMGVGENKNFHSTPAILFAYSKG